MEATARFGPREQTPAQRRALLDRALAINATQDRRPGPVLAQLGPRYVAGELSLAECVERMNQHYPPAPIPGEG